jgi:hypothetical protein
VKARSKSWSVNPDSCLLLGVMALPLGRSVDRHALPALDAKIRTSQTNRAQTLDVSYPSTATSLSRVAQRTPCFAHWMPPQQGTTGMAKRTNGVANRYSPEKGNT